MSKSRKDLETSLETLSLSSNPKKPSSPSKKAPVADSWEDDETSSDSGEDTDRPLTAQSSADYPSAPPPTPISPTTSYSSRESETISFFGPTGEPWSLSSTGSGVSPRAERGVNSRPEKTDAVAKRLVAGALGLRAPKKTEEQRAYDRAVKENEIKRRNVEREGKVRAEEEAAKAKAAAWED